MSEPFLDDTILDSTKPPSCKATDFQRPLLRRSKFGIDSVIFAGHINPNPDSTTPRQLDGGLNGYNWKVQLEKGGPDFVLKLVGHLASSSCLMDGKSGIISDLFTVLGHSPLVSPLLCRTEGMPECRFAANDGGGCRG